MKGLSVCVSVVCLLALTFGPLPSTAIYNNICRLFADNAKLRDPYACDAYITCINSVEVSTSCKKGQLYSIETNKCVDSTSGCDDPCAPDFDSIWAEDPTSCNGYYYCRNGTGTFGVCPSDLHFLEDQQQCVYSWQSDCGSDNYCRIVPNGVNFKNEQACDKYRYCEKGVLKEGSCKSGLLYSKEAGKCVERALVNGCDSMPTDVCMNGKKIEKNKFVSDMATCRGYYYCADKGSVADDNPAWGQCPPNQFFSYSTQSCNDPLTVTCDADRCDGRTVQFVNSNTNCQHYLVCKDGQTVEERTCSNYNFFDEKRQACTSEVITYTACV